MRGRTAMRGRRRLPHRPCPGPRRGRWRPRSWSTRPRQWICCRCGTDRSPTTTGPDGRSTRAPRRCGCWGCTAAPVRPPSPHCWTGRASTRTGAGRTRCSAVPGTWSWSAGSAGSGCAGCGPRPASGPPVRSRPGCGCAPRSPSPRPRPDRTGPCWRELDRLRRIVPAVLDLGWRADLVAAVAGPGGPVPAELRALLPSVPRPVTARPVTAVSAAPLVAVPRLFLPGRRRRR